jgi:hypothetical protein
VGGLTPPASSSSSESPAVKALKDEIARLQAQMAALQAQIARAPETLAATLRGQLTVISNALQVAQQALAELMLGSGQTTGGLVSTQA